MRRTAILLMGVLLLAVGPAAGQLSLPTPAAPIPPGNDHAVTPRLDGSLPTSSYARQIAERVTSALNTLAITIDRDRNMIESLQVTLREARRRKASLESERNRVLADYLKGYFCSTCGKAKSEFGSDSAFWQHIADGAPEGRHAVPATSDQTAAKEADYKARLAQADNEVKQSQEGIDQKESEVRYARDQVREGYALWLAATEMESVLLIATESAASEHTRSELAQADRQLERLRGELRSATVAGDRIMATRVQEAIAVWDQVRARINVDDNIRYAAFLQQTTLARETAIKEYARISTDMVKVLDRPPFVPPILPTGTLSVGPWSFSTDTAKVGMKFKFGQVVSAGITGDRPDGATTEMTTFFEVLGKLRIDVGWRTVATPYGTENGPAFGASIIPPATTLSLPKPNDNPAPGPPATPCAKPPCLPKP